MHLIGTSMKVTATMPDQAIVCDESISLGFYAYDYAASAAPPSSVAGGAKAR